MTETIRVSIKRQDKPDAAPYWQEFRVPKRPSMNVISCLMEIQRNPVGADGKPVTPVTWDCSCLDDECQHPDAFASVLHPDVVAMLEGEDA